MSRTGHTIREACAHVPTTARGRAPSGWRAWPAFGTQHYPAAPMGAREQLTDVFLKGMNQFHRTMMTMTGGRWGDRVAGMTTVELHTTGRTSGRRRSVMLTAPVYEPGRVVLVASKGGDERDPEWYRNLVADPDVELTVGGATEAMTARTATDAERAELWPRIVKASANYAGYQQRTSRQIPVVIVEPR